MHRTKLEGMHPWRKLLIESERKAEAYFTFSASYRLAGSKITLRNANGEPIFGFYANIELRFKYKMMNLFQGARFPAHQQTPLTLFQGSQDPRIHLRIVQN